MSEVLPETIDGLDPNSDAGFESLLARKAGGSLTDEQKESLEASDRSVSAGLTQESAPARDEKGRFAAAPQPEPEGVAPEEDGLAALIERYGDPNKALAAVAKENQEAQSLIGRQGNEVGELRQKAEQLALELAEMRGQLKAQQAQPQATPYVSMEAIDQAFAEEIGNSGDGSQTMAWIANNSPHLAKQAVKVWAQYDPVEAAGYWSRYVALDTVGQAAPAVDPRLESLAFDRSIANALDAVEAGMSKAEWEYIKPHLTPAMEGAPEFVQQAIVSPDPKIQQAAMAHVAELAANRAIAAAAAKAREEGAASAALSKSAAQVASGSLRSVSERQPGEGMTSEERIKRFQELILNTEDTSVAKGLTYGTR